jgi:CRP-like cAMP-binding protein
MVTPPSPTGVGNQLLASLPPDILSRLLPGMRPVSLTVRETLIAPDTTIQSVWFVESGWVSLVTALDDGAQAEVGLVGREGMVGTPLVHGVVTAFSEAYVQANGAALQMETGAFRRALDDEPPFRSVLLRYCEAAHAHTAQTAACNGRHTLKQRLARWLLMGHDRADGDDLPMTQGSLALMLCVYRPSISVAARTLQRAGIIRYTRGHITVLNRSALEDASCDCYVAVKRRFDRLLKP